MCRLPFFPRIYGFIVVFIAAGTSSVAAAPDEGINYYLFKTMVQVDVTHHVTTTSKLRNDCGTEKEESLRIDSAISLIHTADSSCSFVAKNNFSAVTKGKFTYNLSPDGTLTGINAGSEGVGGQIITNVLKFVGGVAGAVTGVGGLPRLSSVDKNKAKSVLECFGEASDLGSRLLGERDILLSRRQRLIEMEERYSGKTSNKDTDALKVISGQAADTNARIQVLDSRIEQEVVKYKTALGLGSKTKSLTFTEYFDIKDLPDAPQGGGAYGMLKSDISNSSPMKPFLENTGVVVAKVQNPSKPDIDCLLSKPTKKETNRNVTIFSRVPYPIELQAFVAKVDRGYSGPGDFDSLTRTKTIRVNVTDNKSEIGKLSLPMSAFAKGTLAVTFAAGTLSTVEREQTVSAGEGLTGALATAPETIIKSYTSSMKSLADSLQDRQKLALADGALEIERLNQEKEKLDRQISFEGVVGNRDAMLEMASINQQISLLESKKNLTLGQLDLEVLNETYGLQSSTRQNAAALAEINARLAFAQAEGGYDDSLQSNLLAIELARLNAQLSLQQGQESYDYDLQSAVLAAELARVNAQYSLDSRAGGLNSLSQQQAATNATNLLELQIKLLELQNKMDELQDAN